MLVVTERIPKIGRAFGFPTGFVPISAPAPEPAPEGDPQNVIVVPVVRHIPNVAADKAACFRPAEPYRAGGHGFCPIADEPDVSQVIVEDGPQHRG